MYWTYDINENDTAWGILLLSQLFSLPSHTYVYIYISNLWQTLQSVKVLKREVNSNDLKGFDTVSVCFDRSTKCWRWTRRQWESICYWLTHFFFFAFKITHVQIGQWYHLQLRTFHRTTTLYSVTPVRDWRYRGLVKRWLKVQNCWHTYKIYAY